MIGAWQICSGGGDQGWSSWWSFWYSQVAEEDSHPSWQPDAVAVRRCRWCSSSWSTPSCLLPLASSCQASWRQPTCTVHTALTGCAVSRRPAFLLQQPPPSPLSSLFSSRFVCFPQNCNVLLSCQYKYAQKQRFL